MRLHPAWLLLLLPTAAHAQSGMEDVIAGTTHSAAPQTAPDATATDTAPPPPPSRQAIAQRLLQDSRRAGSNLYHLLYLDQGLPDGLNAAALRRLPELLGAPAPQTPGGEPFPDRGQLPERGGSLDFLHPVIRSACLVVSRGEQADGLLGASWYGRRAFENDQWWSATKHLQALHVASRLGAAAPEANLGDLRLRARGSATDGVSVGTLLAEVVSYSGGVHRSNAGAETFGRFFTRRQRQAWNVAHTGHPHSFRGAYGEAPVFARPELVDPQGRVVLVGPSSQGASGPNLISAYDVARLTAMAAWHTRLSPSARLAGARWTSLQTVLEAMGRDSARYAEVGLESLGWGDQVQLAVASKLGFGVRSKTGLPELTWVAAIRLEDDRGPVQAVLALKGIHRDAVVLDARVAAEVAEILRRLLERSL
jgi:hypothetical protein